MQIASAKQEEGQDEAHVPPAAQPCTPTEDAASWNPLEQLREQPEKWNKWKPRKI